MSHARRMRPAPVVADRRRLASATASAILPGLGQLINGNQRLALLFGVPSLGLLALVWLLLQLNSPTRLIATIIAPSVLTAVLVLNALVLLWRLASVAQAFLDRHHPRVVARNEWLVLAVLAVFVVVPHLVAFSYGLTARTAFERIFSGPEGNHSRPLPPALTEGKRLNILLMGIDAAAGRDHALTDTLIVVSLDPVGKTVSMVSVPRDMVNVPLGDGNTFGPKINSLLGWANSHKSDFPDGGAASVRKAIGALLGIQIDYTASVDLAGFVKVVDVVGGVDVTVDRPLADPNYGGFGVGPGWSTTAGPHHFDGANALAYARIRKSEGESDFTRAERQQQVLVAIRDAAVKQNLLFSLPRLLDAVGNTVRTDLPPEALPQLAALADEVDRSATTSVVIRFPLVRGERNQYGSVQIPDVKAIQAMAAALFTKPGTPPVPWPTPRPTAAAPSPSPSK